MRCLRIGLVLCIFLIAFSLPSQTQSQSTANTQGITLLTQAAKALSSSIVVSDVTLNGSATRIVGSDNDNGSIVLEALATGQSLSTFAYAAGNLIDVRSISSTTGAPTGSWTGPDNVKHPQALHNLLTDSSWFFPALTLNKLLTSQATVATLIGPETKDSIPVIHLTAYQQFTDGPADAAALMQRLSQMDFYLDATTLLPVALDFSVHPDNNELLDISVEVRFSNYTSVSGVQVPFHIQRYLNNSLMLDIQVQTTTLNSGLNPSAFTVE